MTFLSIGTVETVGAEISLAAMALSVVLGGVFLLSRRFMSDARRVSADCGGGGGELELIVAVPEGRRNVYQRDVCLLAQFPNQCQVIINHYV